MIIKETLWKVNGLVISAIKIDGKYYCTTEELAKALNIGAGRLKRIYERNKELVEKPLYIRDIKDQRDAYQVSAILSPSYDAVTHKSKQRHAYLWPDRAMLRIALWIKTRIGIEFQDRLIDAMIETSTEGMISKDTYTRDMTLQKEEYERGMSLLREELQEVRNLINDCMPWLEDVASANGKALNAQKALKKLEDVN